MDFTEESFRHFCDEALRDLPTNKHVEWETQRESALGYLLRKLRMHVGAVDSASVDPGEASLADRREQAVINLVSHIATEFFHPGKVVEEFVQKAIGPKSN